MLRTLIIVGCLLPGAAPAAPAAAPVPVEKPTVEMLFSNVVARAKWDKSQQFGTQFAYTRSKANEELDEKGRVKELTEKTHQYTPINGRPFARLVTVNGKPLSEKERLAEEQRERMARESAAGTAAPSAPAPTGKKEYKVTPEMFERFIFTVTGLEKVNGRDAWAVTFAPRSKDLPINKFEDRVVNKVIGKVWIDAAEFEVARAQIGLAETVNLVGGIIGTLRKFDVAVERVRQDGGAWFTRLSEVLVDGRGAIFTRRLRFREESKDFKRINPAPPAPEPAGK